MDFNLTFEVPKGAKGQPEKREIMSKNVKKMFLKSNTITQKLPNFLMKHFVKKKTFQGREMRKVSISDLKKQANIKLKMPVSKIQHFLQHNKHPELKEYAQLKNLKANEMEVIMLEQAVKSKRTENKSLVKNIQETEQLLRNFEVMKLKFQNQKHLAKGTSAKKQANRALEMILNMTKKNTSKNKFISNLKNTLLSKTLVAGERREDKLRERQLKAIDQLMAEGIEYQKLDHQMQNVIERLKKKMNETEHEETLLKDQLKKLEMLKGASKKATAGKRESKVNNKKIPDAFKRLIHVLAKNQTKTPNRKSKSLLPAIKLASKAQSKSLIPPSSPNDSALLKSDQDSKLRPPKPAFRPGKRVSFFSKFSHFSGSVENNLRRSNFGSIKTKNFLDPRGASGSQFRSSMKSAFKTLKERFSISKKRNMFGSLNITNPDRSRKFTKNLVNRIMSQVRRSEIVRKSPKMSKMKLEKQIKDILRNRFQFGKGRDPLGSEEYLSKQSYSLLPKRAKKSKKKIKSEKKKRKGAKPKVKKKAKGKARGKSVKKAKGARKPLVKGKKKVAKSRKPSARKVKKPKREKSTKKKRVKANGATKSKSGPKKPSTKRKRKTRTPKAQQENKGKRYINKKTKKKSMKHKRTKSSTRLTHNIFNTGQFKTLQESGNPFFRTEEQLRDNVIIPQINNILQQNQVDEYILRPVDQDETGNVSIVEESLILTSKRPSKSRNLKLQGSIASDSAKRLSITRGVEILKELFGKKEQYKGEKDELKTPSVKLYQKRHNLGITGMNYQHSNSPVARHSRGTSDQMLKIFLKKQISE